MRNLLGLLLACGLIWMFANASGINSSAGQSSGLPAVKRTEIHAPAEATRVAGNALNNSAEAIANAQENDAARVYAQQQIDQKTNLAAIATQQAANATMTANDVSVSKEAATLVAVSLQATRESISRTLSADWEQYQARQIEIQATKEAITNTSFNKSEGEQRQSALDYFWTWVPTLAVVALIGIILYALLNLARRLAPQPQIVDDDDDDDGTQPAMQPAPIAPPQNPNDEKRRERWLADHELSIRYVEDSIRKNGGTSDRLLSAPEWVEAGGTRESHTTAVAHLRELSAIQTKQGGPADEQGTFVQEAGADLLYLLRKLATTPLPR